MQLMVLCLSEIRLAKVQIHTDTLILRHIILCSTNRAVHSLCMCSLLCSSAHGLCLYAMSVRVKDLFLLAFMRFETFVYVLRL